jgi:hypothetical protein
MGDLGDGSPGDLITRDLQENLGRRDNVLLFTHFASGSGVVISVGMSFTRCVQVSWTNALISSSVIRAGAFTKSDEGS